MLLVTGTAFFLWSEDNCSGDFTFDSLGDFDSGGDFLVFDGVFFILVSDDSFYWSTDCFLGATALTFFMSFEAVRGGI